MRLDGHGAWSEPELHAAAFDLSYDYDGWERLEKIWAHELPIERYLEYLYVQETLYPAGAKKLRYVEIMIKSGLHTALEKAPSFAHGLRSTSSCRAWR